ncbi:hypothetical protein [Aureivirga sp. CE67]|uniref:hypothetical protein n=1 Tax=Aureivirga sp. CE67 TaxID=1788983 RepID=UPI0018C8E1C7|nr:hypothetical protein [Aureivirga sp. CE67]
MKKELIRDILESLYLIIFTIWLLNFQDETKHNYLLTIFIASGILYSFFKVFKINSINLKNFYKKELLGNLILLYLVFFKIDPEKIGLVNKILTIVFALILMIIMNSKFSENKSDVKK